MNRQPKMPGQMGFTEMGPLKTGLTLRAGETLLAHPSNSDRIT
ncbi:hypothetical protein ACFRQM_28930 [Streptomyces sp. NPDC056831]